MIQGIKKLLKAGESAGKRYAFKAAAEAIENVVPGGDLGMDISKTVVSKLFDGDSSEHVAAAIKDFSEEDYNKLADLVVDVLTLAEVAARAKMDGDITPEETGAVFDSIDELRVQAETVLTAF